jgi:hypothetical protein
MAKTEGELVHQGAILAGLRHDGEGAVDCFAIVAQ